MKAWWLSGTTRLGQEKRAVEALLTEGWFTLTKWTIHEYKLAAIGTIIVEGHEYSVRLVYGDQFPLIPAWVEPIDKEVHWSSHQYGAGGTLCLELRPDNWMPVFTGADVLRSAYDLLRAENPLSDDHGSVESAHHIGAIQSYRQSSEPILVGKACLDRIADGEAAEVRAQRWSVDGRVWPIFLYDGEESIRGNAPPEPDVQCGRTLLSVYVSREELPGPVPDERGQFLSDLRVDEGGAGAETPILVLVAGENSVRAFHCMEGGSVFERKLVVLDDSTGARSGRDPAAASKRVAVVGVGSVGSKITESLVRSGVRDLLLVDGDVFVPGNIERHVLDWRDIGFEKVHAVKRRLLNISPATKIQVLETNLDWQRSARTYAAQIDLLAGCDVIVDATGNVPTSLFLGAVAKENARPFVSIEVYEGGLGALIARSIPGRDPPFAYVRQAYSSYCAEQNVQPPTSGEKKYEAISSDGIPVIADDASVSAAAAHGARVVLDVLDNKVGSNEAACLLLGFRQGWLFKQHGDNIMLDAGSAPPAKAEQEDDPEIRQFAISLAKEAISAPESSS